MQLARYRIRKREVTYSQGTNEAEFKIEGKTAKTCLVIGLTVHRKIKINISFYTFSIMPFYDAKESPYSDYM